MTYWEHLLFNKSGATCSFIPVADHKDVVTLTHWGRVTHICVSKLTIIGSDNGLSPGRCQAIIWNNTGLLLIEPLGTNFSEISIGIQRFIIQENALEHVVCEMASILSRPQCVNPAANWPQWSTRYFLCELQSSIFWVSEKSFCFINELMIIDKAHSLVAWDHTGCKDRRYTGVPLVISNWYNEIILIDM